MVALIVAVDGIGRKTTTTVLSLSGLYDNLNTNYSRHVVSTRQASSTGIFMTSAVPESPLFTGTDRYIATEDLKLAVNAALTLQRPLLIKGEPGTGKTMLAEEVAAALNIPLITWHVKSTTKAQQGLYEYDAVSRLRDSQLGTDKVHDISNYIVPGKLWEAFTSEKQAVLLIDEVDKADIEFPNDLLLELDRME